MTPPPDRTPQGYDLPYANFESPVMRELRREAYGIDIGQHSWVSVAELSGDIARLGLTRSTRLLDLGCGPGGPLTFMVQATGCTGTGVDLSGAALEAARRRATALGIDALLTVCEADMNAALPFADRAFDVAVSLDVIPHADDRLNVFREVARLLAPAGRFLFTDAGVLTGAISNLELAARSLHGLTQLCAPGFNERMLVEAGFRVLHTEDRTASLLNHASGRLAARAARRSELEGLEGAEHCARQQRYLETVVALARRGALSRVMYFAEVAPA